MYIYSQNQKKDCKSVGKILKELNESQNKKGEQ